MGGGTRTYAWSMGGGDKDLQWSMGVGGRTYVWSMGNGDNYLLWSIEESGGWEQRDTHDLWELGTRTYYGLLEVGEDYGCFMGGRRRAYVLRWGQGVVWSMGDRGKNSHSL